MNDIEFARDIFETTPEPCKNDYIGCKYFNKDSICTELKQAESLINRGYQKIKWHKVKEDGNPTNMNTVLVCYEDKRFADDPITYCSGWYDTRKNEWRLGEDFIRPEVIAWMEVPRYEDYK